MTIDPKENKIVVTLEAKPDHKEWLAKLTGLDTKYVFQREFVSKNRGRSTSTCELTEDGVYEAEDQTGRHYIAVIDGVATEITRDEAKEMLSSQADDEPTLDDIPF